MAKLSIFIFNKLCGDIQNHIAEVAAYAKDQFLAMGYLDETIQKWVVNHSSIYKLEISDSTAKWK